MSSYNEPTPADNKRTLTDNSQPVSAKRQPTSANSQPPQIDNHQAQKTNNQREPREDNQQGVSGIIQKQNHLRLHTLLIDPEEPYTSPDIYIDPDELGLEMRD